MSDTPSATPVPELAQETLRRVIEQAPVTIAMFDRDMRYLAVSRQWASEFGRDGQNLLGQSHYAILTDMPERWIEIHRRGLAGETLSSEEDEWHLADGTTLWLRWVVQPWRTSRGDIGGIIVFSQDITGRKEAARRLRESEAQFRQLAEGLPQLVWSTDPKGEVEFLGPQWSAYAGVALQRQGYPGWLDVIHPDDRAQVVEAWNRSLAQGTDYHVECRIRRHDGQYRWFDARSIPLRNEGGEVERWFGANTDIDDRKRVQELQLRGRQLEALGTLAGGIAHDFNNILAAVCGNIELALEDIAADSPARESLVDAEQAARKGIEHVSRLQAASRQQGSLQEVLHLEGLVNEALALLRVTLSPQVGLRSHLAADTPAVSADSYQLPQLLINLLTNAAQAIGDGPGTIEVTLTGISVGDRSAERRGDWASLREGRYACLTVADTGCGMSPEIQQRIFDPFFTTKAPGAGSGLGLAVVEGIAKAHKGVITVDSEPGKGTRIRLYFPAATDQPRSSTPQQPAPPASPQGRRVLYVDDDEALVSLVVRRLTRMGYTVTGETNPASALSRVRAKPGEFDVIVSDLKMPQMDGFELARELRAVRADLPVVLTSGFVRPADLDTAREIGIRAVIPKPRTIAALTAELDRIFRGAGPG